MVLAVPRLMPLVGFLLLIPAGALAQTDDTRSKLPPCPVGGGQIFHNCFGSAKQTQGESQFEYAGEWKENKYHGWGTYTTQDGERYHGEWSNGQRNGLGDAALESANLYLGEWRQDKMQGFFQVHYANLDSFSGYYLDEKRRGEGTYIWSDGSRFSGLWKDGLPTADGKLTTASGTILLNARYRSAVAYRATGRMAKPDVLTYTCDSDSRQALVPPGVPEVIPGKKPIQARIVGDSEVIDCAIRQQVQETAFAPEPVNVPATDTRRKVALVIGNNAYQHSSPLRNAVNDANAISEKLKAIGFDVTLGLDLTRGSFDQVLRQFASKLDQSDIALIFYSGHGLQVDGVNYLVPVDAKAEDRLSLKFEMIDVRDLIEGMTDQSRINLIFLDSCRNNPLARSLASRLGTSRSASIGKGMAQVTIDGSGVLVAFATAPDNVAADGAGENSPFTEALLKHVDKPGVEINTMMTQVKADVVAATNGQQRPWHNSDLTELVYLAGQD